MCSGNSCNKKQECYRFKATPNEYRQSYFLDVPLNQVDENTENCEHCTKCDIKIKAS